MKIRRVYYLSYNNHKLVASGRYWYGKFSSYNRGAVWTIANKSYNTITNNLTYGYERAFSHGDNYATGRILIRADGSTYDYFSYDNSSIYGVYCPDLHETFVVSTVCGDYGYCLRLTADQKDYAVVVFNLDQPMYEPELITFPRHDYYPSHNEYKTIEVQSSIN